MNGTVDYQILHQHLSEDEARAIVGGGHSFCTCWAHAGKDGRLVARPMAKDPVTGESPAPGGWEVVLFAGKEAA